jgi:hypothetical protein
MDRAPRPLVSVVASDSLHDRAQLAAVRRRLSAQATVLDAPLPVAAGTVVVGERLPETLPAVAFPAWSVPAHGDGPWVAFRRIQAPSRVHLESRITVLATVEAHSVRPQDTVIVSALSGSTVVAEVRRAVVTRGAGARLTVPLTLAPWGLGVASLRIRAVMAGGVDTVRHDVAVTVDTARTPVLFYDRRPSWRSTFERRALARDLRFAVTSRVVTATSARGVTASRVTGAAPMELASAMRTGPGGIVVIGAPEALSTADVRALEGVLRGGATVVLLPDHAAPGPVDALLGTGGWRVVTRRSPSVVHGPGVTGAPSDSLRWQGQVIGVPNHLPFGAERLAWLAETGETVVWRVPVGEGMLVVSGVFDAWRTAGNTPTTPATAMTAPASPATETATETANAPGTGAVKTATAVPLPVLRPGDPLPVGADRAAAGPAPRRPAFPMHAPLWLVPLLACLSAEWWLRRRRGLR